MSWRVFSLIYSGFFTLNFYQQKEAALNLARSLVTDKGIINLGAGCSRDGWTLAVCELPEVTYNLDIADCPNCLDINLEQPLPFRDKDFDVSFASHVLEHLNNWQAALDEWSRISDHVVLVLPNPLSISGWLHPQHKQHFGYQDIIAIEKAWPQVTIFR